MTAIVCRFPKQIYTRHGGYGELILNPLLFHTADDHQAPKVIGCPDSINVNLPQGNSDVVVTWTEPSTSETIGVSMTKTHQPGSIFTDGVTTVLYTFTDQAGNSTICTFNVTVSSE